MKSIIEFVLPDPGFRTRSRIVELGPNDYRVQYQNAGEPGVWLDEVWFPWVHKNMAAAMITGALAIAKESQSMRAAIDFLRECEGDSVQIFSDNPDEGPGCAIDVCGDWTQWVDIRIEGDSLNHCLQRAVGSKLAKAMDDPAQARHVYEKHMMESGFPEKA